MNHCMLYASKLLTIIDMDVNVFLPCTQNYMHMHANSKSKTLYSKWN